jgi:hypothetical protein
MTIKRLKSYDNDILNKIIKCEKEAQIKYQQNNELDHYRMSIKTVEKIKKILKEREK